MMHDITVRCGNGLGPLDLSCPKLTIGRITAFGLGKSPASVRRVEPVELWVPARAVLALLLAQEAVRTGCVPTCVVLTGDCWVWQEELLTLVSKCE